MDITLPLPSCRRRNIQSISIYAEPTIHHSATAFFHSLTMQLQFVYVCIRTKINKYIRLWVEIYYYTKKDSMFQKVYLRIDREKKNNWKITSIIYEYGLNYIKLLYLYVRLPRVEQSANRTITCYGFEYLQTIFCWKSSALAFEYFLFILYAALKWL